MARGRLIMFEGGEGGGKSTLVQRLKDEQFPAVFSREPGGTPWGEALREYITDPAKHPADPESRMILNTATRFELMKKVVQPALRSGQHAVLDRSWPSAWAYNWRVELNKPLASLPEFIERFVVAHDILVPDLLCWLDLDPAIGLERAKRKRSGLNEYDSAGLAFHERIRQAYQELYDAITNRTHPIFSPLTVVKIDASQTAEQVYHQFLEAMASVESIT